MNQLVNSQFNLVPRGLWERENRHVTSRCQDLFPPSAPLIFQRQSPGDDVGKVLSLLSVRDHINTGDKGHLGSTSTEESYVRSLALFLGVLGQFTSVRNGWRHPGEANPLLRLDHVTHNELAARNNEAQRLHPPDLTYLRQTSVWSLNASFAALCRNCLIVLQSFCHCLCASCFSDWSPSLKKFGIHVVTG